MLLMSQFVVAHQEGDTAVGRYLAELPTEPTDAWWAVLQAEQPQEPDTVNLEQLLEIADRVATQDANTILAQQECQKNIEERDRLNELRLMVQAQDLKRQQQVDSVAAAKVRIAQFDVTNDDLIKKVAAEKIDIERDTPIKAAYDHFLAEIRKYREQLPGSLMTGLNE